MDAQEQPVDLAVDRGRAAELAQLLALRGRAGREAHARAAHEHGERGADVVRRREQRPVLEHEPHVPQGELEVAHAHALRIEREVDEAFHLAQLLARDDAQP